MRRAIVSALGQATRLEPLSDHRPNELFSLLDTPIIVHIISTLARMGVRDIELLLHNYPEQIGLQVGTGERWGVNIHVHLIKNPEAPLVPLVPAAQRWDEDEVLVGVAHTLPDYDLSRLNTGDGVFDLQGEWSGWGALPVSDIVKLSSRASFGELSELFTNRVESAPLILSDSFGALIESNKRLLTHSEVEKYLPSDARVYQPGVWVGRGVRISHSATLVAPVYIGSDSQIEDAAHIGPCTTIDHHCFIDSHATVAQSVIFGDSYVGENLEIEHCVVDRNLLVNVRLGSTLEVHDDFILSSLTSIPLWRQLLSVFARIGAFFLMLVLSPWILIQLLSKELRLVRVVGESDRIVPWLCFADPVPRVALGSQLPALYGVMRGWAHLVGVQPRTKLQLEALSSDWKALYYNSKIGLLTQAHFLSITPSTEEVYSSEAYYVAHQSPFFDGFLTLKYICESLICRSHRRP